MAGPFSWQVNYSSRALSDKRYGRDSSSQTEFRNSTFEITPHFPAWDDTKCPNRAGHEIRLALESPGGSTLAQCSKTNAPEDCARRSPPCRGPLQTGPVV